MDYSHGMTPPSSHYHTNINTLSNTTSHLFRPSKILKPNSRNGSPHTLSRRRTTTSATISSRTRSVVDQLRSNPQSVSSQPFPGRSRPVSWHPRSVDTGHQLHLGEQDFPNFPQFMTTQVNGLITPMSYPVNDGPQIQELITPLDEYPCYDTTDAYHNQYYDNMTWLCQPSGKMDNFSLPTHGQNNVMESSWQYSHLPYSAPVQTAPSSPDCPPSTGMDGLSLGTTDPQAKDSGEELVGMGLYDSPAQVHSTSFFFEGSTVAQRKSLKLEESFEPTEREEEDDDEVDDQDDAEEDEDVADQDSFQVPEKTSYPSQSIASHFPVLAEQNQDSIAAQYLATLGQLNSPYYPSSHGYGWV